MMQGPAQASTSMNPPDGPTTRSVLRSGMDADLYNSAVEGSVKVFEICRDSLSSKVTATGNTVLHLHVGIPASKDRNPKIQFIQKVLVHQPSLLLQKNENEEIPLHLAARFGHADAVKVFIDQATGMGAGFLREMLATKDRKKDTALHHAARRKYDRIVELLLSADNDCRNARNDDGETPLYIAAERNYNKIVELLVRGDHKRCPDARNDDGHEITLHIAGDELNHYKGVATISETCYEGPLGRTELHAAALWGHEGTVKAILEYNNLLLQSKDREGQTPLHYVAGAKGEIEDPRRILKVILEYDNTNQSAVYIQDNEGRTALHLAALYGGVELIKLLIEHRPDCTEMRDDKGRTLFHYAAKSKRPRTIKYLLSNAIVGKLVNEKDHEGKTPLHLLANSFSHKPREYFKCIKAFKEDKEVDLRAFNSQNQTAGDIIYSQRISCNYKRGELFDIFVDLVLPDKLRTPFEEMPDESPDISRLDRFVQEEKDIMSKYKKICEVHIIVAALIATVSFAAGIAIPGGFDQAHGNALLATKNTAFRVFVVSDTLALTLSSIAILFHSSIARLEEPLIVRFLYIPSVAATTLSLGAMMIAFMAGTFATMYRSPFLLKMILCLTTIYLIYYAYHLINSLTEVGLRVRIKHIVLRRSYVLQGVLFLCAKKRFNRPNPRYILSVGEAQLYSFCSSYSLMHADVHNSFSHAALDFLSKLP